MRPGRGRGGGWVVAQFALMATIVVACFLPPRWPDEARPALVAVGTVLAAGGAVVATWAYRTLGRSFTPFPRPLPAGELVELGPYRIVRHPMYAAGLAVFAGLALWASVPALGLTGALAVLWALKARSEERHLRERFPGYAAYATRVRSRLVPGVY